MPCSLPHSCGDITSFVPQFKSPSPNPNLVLFSLPFNFSSTLAVNFIVDVKGVDAKRCSPREKTKTTLTCCLSCPPWKPRHLYRWCSPDEQLETKRTVDLDSISYNPLYRQRITGKIDCGPCIDLITNVNNLSSVRLVEWGRDYTRLQWMAGTTRSLSSRHSGLMNRTVGRTNQNWIQGYGSVVKRFECWNRQNRIPKEG